MGETPFLCLLVFWKVLSGGLERQEDGRCKQAKEAVREARIRVLFLDDDRPPLKGGCQTRGQGHVTT